MVSTQSVGAGRRAEIVGAIRDASARTGVDFGYLLHQARVESNLNPEARARTSSATGLFQFIDQTWLATVARHGAEHGLGWAANAISRGPGGRYEVSDPQTRRAILDLRRDPQSAASMAGAYAADNRVRLEQRLGRAADGVDLYLAHFLGASGAAHFLEARAADPDTPAAAVMPAAARSNPGVFYHDGRARSLDEVHRLLGRRMGEGGDGMGGALGATPLDARYTLAANGVALSRTPPDAPAGDSTAQVLAQRGERSVSPRTQLATLAYLTLAQLGG